MIKINGDEVNIADVIIKIIDRYIALKQESYTHFIGICKSLQKNFDSKKVTQLTNDKYSDMLQNK